MEKNLQISQFYVKKILFTSHLECKENLTNTLPMTSDYLVFFVHEGSVNITAQGKKSVLSKEHLAIITPTKEVSFYSNTPLAVVTVISFLPDSYLVNLLINQQFHASEEIIRLFHKMAATIKQLEFQQKRKPSILYDKEFGDLYVISLSFIYNYLTEVLLLVTENNILYALPLYYF